MRLALALTSAQADRLRKAPSSRAPRPVGVGLAAGPGSGTIEDLRRVPDTAFRAAAERLLHKHQAFCTGVSAPVPTKNLIRTVCVTDRAVLGRRTITSVGMADVRSVEVDGRLASFGRSSGRRVSVHGLQAPAIRGCGQAACRW